jgi:hypothetical protein
MNKEKSESPLEKARTAAIESLEVNKSSASEIAQPFLTYEVLNGLIDIAVQSKFDDSPLIMKQKIRKLLKSHIRKEA